LSAQAFTGELGIFHGGASSYRIRRQARVERLDALRLGCLLGGNDGGISEAYRLFSKA
jgi:hypothetical protein